MEDRDDRGNGTAEPSNILTAEGKMATPAEQETAVGVRALSLASHDSSYEDMEEEVAAAYRAPSLQVWELFRCGCCEESRQAADGAGCRRCRACLQRRRPILGAPGLPKLHPAKLRLLLIRRSILCTGVSRHCSVATDTFRCHRIAISK